MKEDLAKLQVLIRKAEIELDRMISLLSKKSVLLKDTDVVKILMFRKIIEKLDAVFILQDNGHFNTANSICRDAFENYVYFVFMLEERSEYRALAYQYQSIQTQLELISWFDPTSKKGKKLKKLLGSKPDSMPQRLQERKSYLQKRMTAETFNNIHIDWKLKKSKFYKGGKFPTWYNISGGKDSIAALCRDLGMADEYETIYSLLSHEVHSINAMNQLIKVEDQVAFMPIRVDESEGFSTAVAISIGSRSTLRLLQEYDLQSANDYTVWFNEVLPREVDEELKAE